MPPSTSLPKFAFARNYQTTSRASSLGKAIGYRLRSIATATAAPSLLLLKLNRSTVSYIRCEGPTIRQSPWKLARGQG